MTRWERRPTAAELGLEVTVCIAGISVPDGHLVAVTDQQISYYDEYPVEDQGIQKVLRLTRDGKWLLAFAANNIPLALPVARRAFHALKEIDPSERKASVVQGAVELAYDDARREEFTAQHIRQMGYTFETFRDEGLNTLGKDLYSDLMKKLHESNLGAELLVFGHNELGHPHLFTVKNPGRATDWSWQRYAVIGEGSTIAMGALRHRPMSHDFGIEDLIYRLLEAKFAADSSVGSVGKPTTLVTLNQDGGVFEMPSEEIHAVRAAWEERRKQRTPEDAYQVIRASRAVRNLSEGER